MTGPGLPMLAVTGDLRDALAPGALRALDEGALARWLTGRRWFGAKGEPPRAARVAAVVPLPWGALGAALVVLELELPSGERQRYQLPLAVREAGAPTPEGAAPPIARVRAGASEGLLVDAVEDADFRDALGDAFTAGARFAGDGATFVVEPLAGQPIPALGDGRPGSAEQSNTSILYPPVAILKLFRRLQDGENPDVEITRFLSVRAGFRGTPALLGTIRLEQGGTSATAGMLQALVRDAVDGWNFALERGRAYFADHGRVAPANTFIAEARKLGRLTGELHTALASVAAAPGFEPQLVGREEIDGWQRAADASIERGLGLLESALAQGAFRDEQKADVEEALSAREAFHDYVRRSADRIRGHAGFRIRHHGDFHLGQVLRDGEGRWWVIDFEGEPARPLAERRESHSPLRDVAGMLRSFVYAAATLERGYPDGADEDTIGRHHIRADLWERAVRDAYLEAYAAAAPAAMLPDGSERSAALLALFETEKVFYELAYEMNNRPDWLWIPLRGILRLPCR